MIPFQYAGIVVCLLFAGWGLRRLRRRQGPGWLSLLAILVGSLGAITIFDPEITTRVAQAVGIARGADLLIYLVALAFFGSWFYFYQRIRSLSNAVTMLVREMAIRDPRPATPGRAGEGHGEDSPRAQPPDQS